MADERFAEADKAFSEGRRDDGIRLAAEELERDPKAPLPVYRNLTATLIRAQRYEDAERWARQGTEIHPRDFDLFNNLGVSLRRLRRYDEALDALARAEKINPKNSAALINRGNIYNDMRNGPAAVAVWSKLVRATPANASYQRALGRAYLNSGDLEKAEMRFRLATRLKKDDLDAWLDLIAIVGDRQGMAASLAVMDDACAALPTVGRLREAKSALLRRANRHKEAEAYLLGLMDQFGGEAWLHHQLGLAVAEWDRGRAHQYMRRSIELDPKNLEYRMGLAESLSRTRGPEESAMLEQAYFVLKEALDLGELTPSHLKVASEILTRLADFDAADRLGDFKTLGRTFAEAGKHTALLAHLAKVKTPEDRLELVEQHRIWGDLVLSRVAAMPISHPKPRAPGGKIRLGFMSSDLRGHPVAYFALPLFEHYDRSRFEVYCYSWYLHDEDKLQASIRGMVDQFRWEKEITDHDAAQMIANDQLDMLIELGGSTHMNKIGVMAYKPAPLQASWLGYPHSAGLSNIDHFILDPYVNPERRELVIEEPLLMPRSWIAMGELAFPERPITPGVPEARKGHLTFGSANNPYKYSRAMIQAWAQVTAAVPDSRFMFVRPEGGSKVFRDNIVRIFESEGVSSDRITFEAVRGAHMPFYNEIDISLDTFPQTGGTTTCEALFMGVPVVTLVGDAVFERLSYSILTNAGLGDLCARTEEDFLRIALELAGDRPRREHLRTNLRGMLKASPLGQTRQFAADFYEMIAGAVSRSRAKTPEPA